MAGAAESVFLSGAFDWSTIHDRPKRERDDYASQLRRMRHRPTGAVIRVNPDIHHSQRVEAYQYHTKRAGEHAKAGRHALAQAHLAAAREHWRGRQRALVERHVHKAVAHLRAGNFARAQAHLNRAHHYHQASLRGD